MSMKKIYFYLLALFTFQVHAQTYTHTETFDNAVFDSSSNNSWGSYGFTSPNGPVFYYEMARNASPNYPISGKGIHLRYSQASFIEITFPDGLKDIYFEYRKASAESYREKNIEVLLVANDNSTTSLGVTPTFGATNTLDATIHNFSIADINRAGSVKIKIKNIGSDTSLRDFVIDNLKWNEYNTASVTDNQIAGLSIFPNPATNVLNVTSEVAHTKFVEIYDVIGKQVLKTKTDRTINISNLKSGVYIVKVTQDGKTASRKLIVK